MRQQKSQCHAMPDSPERNGPTPNWDGSFSRWYVSPTWLPAARKREWCLPPLRPGSGGSGRLAGSCWAGTAQPSSVSAFTGEGHLWVVGTRCCVVSPLRPP